MMWEQKTAECVFLRAGCLGTSSRGRRGLGQASAPLFRGLGLAASVVVGVGVVAAGHLH